MQPNMRKNTNFLHSNTKKPPGQLSAPAVFYNVKYVSIGNYFLVYLSLLDLSSSAAASLLFLRKS